MHRTTNFLSNLEIVISDSILSSIEQFLGYQYISKFKYGHSLIKASISQVVLNVATMQLLFLIKNRRKMKWSIKDTRWLNQIKNKQNLVSFVSEQNRQQVFSNNWRKKQQLARLIFTYCAGISCIMFLVKQLLI